MKGLEMKYFVLKPRSRSAGDPYARASRIAMLSYAASIRKENPDLSHQLEAWATDEDENNARMELNY
jgi:hypothetical protein